MLFFPEFPSQRMKRLNFGLFSIKMYVMFAFAFAFSLNIFFLSSNHRMTMYRCKMRLLYLLWLYITIVSGGSLSWQPCPELSSALRYPCRCKVEPFGPKSQLGAVSMDCDHVVFHTESPILPNSAPIISFSQRHCGQQVLPTQVRQEIATKFAIKLPHFFYFFSSLKNVTIYSIYSTNCFFIFFLQFI